MGKIAERAGTVTLDFRPVDDGAPRATPQVLRGDLSACEITGSCLWLACDETTTVERLVTHDGSRFAGHRAFDLSCVFHLPSGGDEEIDIEGLAFDGGCLWITGSHSLKRKKPKRHESDTTAALERLTQVEREANRYFLGRLPLVPTGDPDVYDVAGFGAGDPRAGFAAACLPMTNGKNALAAAVAEDVHLGRFMEVPSKENGVDVEGIAASGERVFLGLRGPVLRGWAVVLELSVGNPQPERLALNGIGPGGEPYRKHFLDLDGLGIRDLMLHNGDLLILAGPTMDLDGPVAVFRWPAALAAKSPEVVSHERLERVLDLPFGDGVDHPEGMALIARREEARPQLLIVCDSPGPARLHANGTAITADLFTLPG
jgi:hypothetical protein